jgi:hypothetical protein
MTPLFIKAINAPVKPTPVEKGKEPKVTAPDIGYFHDLLGLLASHKAGGDFGPDSVEVDHHVAFKAGDFAGSGKVTSTGRDGLCVTDSSRREHRVHWREVTGHFAPEKQEKGPKKPTTPKAKAKQAADGN